MYMPYDSYSNIKKGAVKDGHFTYTVMAITPLDCVSVRYELNRVALRQALGSRSAEIGIASFMDDPHLWRGVPSSLPKAVRVGDRGISKTPNMNLH